MRAQFIYEKFTEGSDPIADMDIGLYRHRNFNSIKEFHEWLFKVAPYICDIKKTEDVLINKGKYTINTDCYNKLFAYSMEYLTIHNITERIIYVDEFRELIRKKTGK